MKTSNEIMQEEEKRFLAHFDKMSEEDKLELILQLVTPYLEPIQTKKKGDRHGCYRTR